VAELRAPEVAWLGVDYRFVAIAATLVPRGDLDVIASGAPVRRRRRRHGVRPVSPLAPSR
jgi:hypothetical protein